MCEFLDLLVYTNLLYGTEETVTLTPAIDIFAFGMCALETAALELTTTGEGQVKVGRKIKVTR